METFPILTNLLTDPMVASAMVVIIVNVISYATGWGPKWLGLVVGLMYMVLGYLVTGQTSPEQLFMAVLYSFLIVAPLSAVDGTLLNRLFGRPTPRAYPGTANGVPRQFWQPWI